MPLPSSESIRKHISGYFDYSRPRFLMRKTIYTLFGIAAILLAYDFYFIDSQRRTVTAGLDRIMKGASLETCTVDGLLNKTAPYDATDGLGFITGGQFSLVQRRGTLTVDQATLLTSVKTNGEKVSEVTIAASDHDNKIVSFSGKLPVFLPAKCFEPRNG